VEGRIDNMQLFLKESYMIDDVTLTPDDPKDDGVFQFELDRWADDGGLPARNQESHAQGNVTIALTLRKETTHAHETAECSGRSMRLSFTAPFPA
jgi:hypothetical protein